MRIPDDTMERLKEHQQTHLVQFWDQLNEKQQAALLKQIEEIDFTLLQRLVQLRTEPAHPGGSGAERAARAQGLQQVVRLPQSAAAQEAELKAIQKGEHLLADGKVGAILVAGGQGSRLGFEAPKGMFPIGPLTDRTLFQILCEQLLARSRRAGQPIPYFIMTSEATHVPTVAFFERHRYFGLGEDNVFFFQQASLPALDMASTQILLESPGRLATSPDGHGGMLRALQNSGLLDVMRDRGIEHLYYHQVDNPTAIVCDPAMLGHHALTHSDMTTKVVAKVNAEEKMGVLAAVDGQTQIIEYSDLPIEQARRQAPDGNLLFWAGNTAIHVFRRQFFEQLLQNDLSLPFHIANKKVPYVDAAGRSVQPSQPNATKFEQFIFDALPHAQVALVVEGDRAREFNPVKNADGNDSPMTCREALARIARAWVESTGARVNKGVTIEISPLYALDADELGEKLPEAAVFKQDTVLN
ncbi:UTP--glucose-1-phosphate uridylyltransferase [Planctomicrobium sp. SH664]|uniref:UTP--glucose-1-phosphate uridylyltransferase n=1 Tax=Planctomicrobium sp. SH664 TaxID=3448125 RepID=UPI003F5BA3CB